MSHRPYESFSVISKTPDNSDEAIIVGGYSESIEVIMPLAEELLNSQVFNNVMPIPLSEALRYSHDFKELIKSRTVVTHSLGSRAVHEAGAARRFIALHGAEPISLPQMALGALAIKKRYTQLQKQGLIQPVNVTNAAIEALSPETRAAPLWARRFSTSTEMIKGGEDAYPDARILIYGEKDEFRFNLHDEGRSRAIEAGILTVTHPEAYHNDPLHFPKVAAQQIAELLEEAKAK